MGFKIVDDIDFATFCTLEDGLANITYIHTYTYTYMPYLNNVVIKEINVMYLSLSDDKMSKCSLALVVIVLLVTSRDWASSHENEYKHSLLTYLFPGFFSTQTGFRPSRCFYFLG